MLTPGDCEAGWIICNSGRSGGAAVHGVLNPGRPAGLLCTLFIRPLLDTPTHQGGRGDSCGCPDALPGALVALLILIRVKNTSGSI